MDSYKFQKACKEWLINYYKENYGKELGIEDIYVVWSCKTLQNNKVLISTTVLDGIYENVPTTEISKKHILISIKSKKILQLEMEN